MKTIIIAGMHQSGTSSITQWLNACGLNAGVYCVPENQSGVDEPFGDLEFIRIHEDILKANDLPETGLTAMPVNRISDYNHDRIEHLFRLKNDFFDQWGWSDPRSCLFLKYYLNSFPELNFLFVLRDFKSVVSSLLSRDFKKVEAKYLSGKFISRFMWMKFRRNKRMKLFYEENATHLLKIWIAYNEQILYALPLINSQKYMLLSSSVLNRSDREAFRFLQDNWQLDLDYIPFKEVFKSELVGRMIDLEDYIPDNDILNKAKDLESRLQVQLLIQDLNVYAK